MVSTSESNDNNQRQLQEQVIDGNDNGAVSNNVIGNINFETCIYREAVLSKIVVDVDERSKSQVLTDQQNRKLYLPNGEQFDFYDYCKPESKRMFRKLIHPDYFNTKGSGCIKSNYIDNRLTFLNLSLVSGQLKEDAERELEYDREKSLQVAIRMTTHLVIALAKCYNIKLSDRFAVNPKQICDAFVEITKKEEAEPFWHVYYGFFDSYPLWQRRLENAILHEMEWKYDDEVVKFRGLKKGICFRIASDAINFLRRQVNDHGKRHLGMIITISRTSDEINEDNRYERRKSGKFQSHCARWVSKESEGTEVKRTRKEKKRKGIDCNTDCKHSVKKKRKQIEKASNDSVLNEDGDDKEDSYSVGSDDTSDSKTVTESGEEKINSKKDEEILRLRKELEELRAIQKHREELVSREKRIIEEEDRNKKVLDAKKKMVSNNNEINKKREKKNNDGREEIKDDDKNEGKVVQDMDIQGDANKEIEWEIVADSTKPMMEYEPEQHPVGNDDEDDGDRIVKIHNIRKEKGKQAELLCEYKYGARWWCLVVHVYKDKKELVYNYLENCNVDSSKLGYKIPPKKVGGINNRGWKERNEIVLQECHNDHMNWLLYEEEWNAGYCKAPYHFCGVCCNICGCKFTHTKVSDEKKEFRPTKKKPIHCCANRNDKSVQCKHSMCHYCFLDFKKNNESEEDNDDWIDKFHAPITDNLTDETDNNEDKNSEAMKETDNNIDII